MNCANVNILLENFQEIQLIGNIKMFKSLNIVMQYVMIHLLQKTNKSHLKMLCRLLSANLLIILLRTLTLTVF